MLSDLNVEYVKNLLVEWGLKDYIKIFDNRSRPRFIINSTNKKILDAFREKGWIEPVSYTHLDVYKRQLQYPVQRNL